jgi:chitin synthase
VLIVSSITGPAQILPLILLAGILGLPAVLILLTSRRPVYIYWLLVYLTALPIWNFIFPVYAFWHFDDFSWGETRRIEGEIKGAYHENDGVMVSGSLIPLKRWDVWERERRKQLLVGHSRVIRTRSFK